MKGIDHQLRKFFIIKQILLFSTRGNVLRSVWRISILILECRGLGTTKLCNKSQDVLFSLKLVSLRERVVKHITAKDICQIESVNITSFVESLTSSAESPVLLKENSLRDCISPDSASVGHCNEKKCSKCLQTKTRTIFSALFL